MGIRILSFLNYITFPGTKQERRTMTYEKYALLRDQHGYTDAKVAEATGIAPATLSQWKNDKSKPKADKLLKIADLLDVPVDVLIRE